MAASLTRFRPDCLLPLQLPAGHSFDGRADAVPEVSL
jgi:hypothetical protein